MRDEIMSAPSVAAGGLSLGFRGGTEDHPEAVSPFPQLAATSAPVPHPLAALMSPAVPLARPLMKHGRHSAADAASSGAAGITHQRSYVLLSDAHDEPSPPPRTSSASKLPGSRALGQRSKTAANRRRPPIILHETLYEDVAADQAPSSVRQLHRQPNQDPQGLAAMVGTAETAATRPKSPPDHQPDAFDDEERDIRLEAPAGPSDQESGAPPVASLQQKTPAAGTEAAGTQMVPEEPAPAVAPLFSMGIPSATTTSAGDVPYLEAERVQQVHDRVAATPSGKEDIRCGNVVR